MNLVDTGDLLDIALGGAVAANQARFNAEWNDVDASTGAFTPGHGDGLTNNATVVTLVASPGATTYRLVRTLTIYNADTADVTVTIRFDNSGAPRELIVAVLSPGDTLVWSLGRSWKIVRNIASGKEYGEAENTKRGIIEIATPGDMREGNNNTMVIVPGRVQYHLGVTNCWGKASGDGLTLNANFNITSVSDTGTGRLGVNIAADFVEANYVILCSLIRGVTTYAVGDVEDNNLRFNAQFVGAFEIESYDHTATTMLVDDPASYFWNCLGHQLS